MYLALGLEDDVCTMTEGVSGVWCSLYAVSYA